MKKKVKFYGMPLITLYFPLDNISVNYWQTGSYFYRKAENDKKAKRISENEYMSAYETKHNY